MVAGPGFEPGMLLAYETGVVAALPAVICYTLLVLLYAMCKGEVMVSEVGFELTISCSQSRRFKPD